MDEFEAGLHSMPLHAPTRAAKLVRLAGVSLSLMLVAGLPIWAYKIAVRQLHGIPVIAAPEGPARVAPENPGGELADHQGLAVNMIASEGEAERAADLLVLAPSSAELAPEDTASTALTITSGTALAPLAHAAAPEAGRVRPSETMRAMLPPSGQGAEPLPDGPVDPVDSPDLESVEAGAIEAALVEAGAEPSPALVEDSPPVAAISADVPGVVSSPIPMMKPGTMLMAASAAATVIAEPLVQDIDPAALESGAQLAQIGSYESEAEAKLAWSATTLRFGGLFDGKARVIQQAESGGRTFFRLRVAGFANKDEARRFCSALKSNGQCVPVQVR